MGDVITLASAAERRRSRHIRLLHETCLAIVAASVAAERAALAGAPPGERAVRIRRLRKFEELEAYAAAMG